jgi:hypothetical protein
MCGVLRMDSVRHQTVCSVDGLADLSDNMMAMHSCSFEGLLTWSISKVGRRPYWTLARRTWVALRRQRCLPRAMQNSRQRVTYDAIPRSKRHKPQAERQLAWAVICELLGINAVRGCGLRCEPVISRVFVPGMCGCMSRR